MNGRKFSPFYILAVLYVMLIYSFPAAFFIFAEKDKNGEVGAGAGWALLIPAAAALVNLILVLVFGKNTDRTVFLSCAVIIKYCLIPFFIAGGFCIAAAILLTFTPVVIMIFVGPAVAVSFTVLGYISLLGSAPFSIAYISRAKKEGIHSGLLCAAAAVFQFFFAGDVISVMVLALKEKRCIRSTIAMIIILILAVVVLLIWLAVKIIGIFI